MILIPEVWTDLQNYDLFIPFLSFLARIRIRTGQNMRIRADLDPDPKPRFKTNIFPNYVPYQIIQPTSWPKLQIIKMLKKSSLSPEYIFRISDGIDIFGNLISYKEKILYIHCFYIW